MLFLLFLAVVGCVALFWRYLQIYAPSNMLIRHVRSAPPRWRTGLSLLALTVTLLGVMDMVSQAIGRGAAGWLNLVVLVVAWDAIKFAVASIRVALLASLTTARSGAAKCRSAVNRGKFQTRVTPLP